MSKILKIGSLQFDNHLIQAPLAGISAAPFRRLIWRFNHVAYAATEMLSCKTLLHASPQLLHRYITKDKDEKTLCFQLSSNYPLELGEAVKKATDLGADMIDLNCGCPVKKIRTRGAGSALLTQPALLYELISTMKKNTHLPVTIKIRVSGGSTDRFNHEVASVVQEAGADALIVHGRHWTEHYETPCNYDDIQFFVEALTIPVIGNGDVADLDSLKRMLKTGCAGAMIGRAGVGQPWLFQKLTRLLSGEVFSELSDHEQGVLLLEHVDGLIGLLGNEKFALLQARTFAKYYARGRVWRDAFAARVNVCAEVGVFRELVAEYFR